MWGKLEDIFKFSSDTITTLGQWFENVFIWCIAIMSAFEVWVLSLERDE